MTTEDLARLGYETNRAYGIAIGEAHLPHWEDVTADDRWAWLQMSEFLLDGFGLSPLDIHDKWLALEKELGWGLGPTLDNAAKRHPYHVPFNRLPETQKTKSYILEAIAYECT